MLMRMHEPSVPAVAREQTKCLTSPRSLIKQDTNDSAKI